MKTPHIPLPSASHILAAAALALFLLPALPLHAQQSLAEDPGVADALHLLDTWMDAAQAYGGIPGASLSVVHDQELIWAKGYGYAHVETEEPATPSTMYSICSISKLFTAVGALQLRDRGKVDLDDPVAKHLDWFNIQDDDPEAGPVTVEGCSPIPRGSRAKQARRTGPAPTIPSRPTSRSSARCPRSRCCIPRAPTTSTPTWGLPWPARSWRRRPGRPTTPTSARTSWTRWRCPAPSPTWRTASGATAWRAATPRAGGTAGASWCRTPGARHQPRRRVHLDGGGPGALRFVAVPRARWRRRAARPQHAARDAPGALARTRRRHHLRAGVLGVDVGRRHLHGPRRFLPGIPQPSSAAPAGQGRHGVHDQRPGRRFPPVRTDRLRYRRARPAKGCGETGRRQSRR